MAELGPALIKKAGSAPVIDILRFSMNLTR